ncbi:MAG: hypothetical protein QXR89_05080 [Candidatus Bathyarchaeia archaeon]
MQTSHGNDSKRSAQEFFKLYLTALATTLILLTSGALIYTTIMNKPFLETIRGALIIGALVLLGMGFVSLLPFFGI